MAIEKLADRAISTLGAHQTLTDPAALVKELLDNALDANATSIAIEISTNTLDVIQLRDNGHGIAPEDRAMVARPNCTSKLHNFDDLKAVGGSSLGFRGQALASAAEMSGTLTISTRVEGESVAASLQINQAGEVVSQDRASLPVGTTVRVTDFIKANPVRRQRALKDAENCLKHIKQILQAYAFARPHTRLSLRVLKAKSDKGNYMYAPKPGGSVEDAALKVVGSACVSQCVWTVVEDQGFTLQAFVPRPDGDSAGVSKFGTFLSVDGRPVSAARGTLKQIVKIFRHALKKSASCYEGIKDPFIHMRIACPSASYDPNVEPAKDDVIFEDSDVVVALARRLFNTVYLPLQVPTATESIAPQGKDPTSPGPAAIPQEDDFITSLEPQHNVLPGAASSTSKMCDAIRLPTPVPTSELAAPRAESALPNQRAFRSNMYGCDEEEIDLMDARPSTGRTEADFEELRQARNDVAVFNPWVIAKMNTSLRRPVTAEAVATSERLAYANHPRDSAEQSSLPMRGAEQLGDNDNVHGLPTPRPSSPSPPAQSFHPLDHVPDIRLARDGRMIGSQALPPPRMGLERSPDPQGAFASRRWEDSAAREPPAYDYTMAGHAFEANSSTPLRAIPDASQRTRRSPRKQLGQTPRNRLFVSPVVEGPPKEKVWFDHLEEEGRHRPKQKRQYQPRDDSNRLIRLGELGNLIEDPRPLTPPRRNRDIRDFVGSIDLTTADSASSFVERRNYAQARCARSLSEPRSIANDENASPSKAIRSGRGFVPASELAAMEAQLGSLNNESARPPKCRKTSEAHVLRELSVNASTTAQQDHSDEDRAAIASRAVSRRRRTVDTNTGKVHHTKSSRLPLERIPKGLGMHNIELRLTTSVGELSRSAGKLDEEASLLGWNQPALDAYGGLAALPDAGVVDVVAAKLHELLINRVSDGEMVQDLGELLQRAFMAHYAQSDDMEGVSMA